MDRATYPTRSATCRAERERTRHRSVNPMLKLVAGKRLIHRPLTGTTELRRRHRPLHKGGRDTCCKKILKTPAANIY